MRSTFHVTALALCTLLVGSLAHAQTVATLTCQASGGSSITAPVFAFAVAAYGYDLGATYIGVAEVYVDPTSFASLLSASAANTVYPSCSLVNGTASLTFTKAALEGVDIEAYAGGLEGANSEFFTDANLTFETLTVGGVTVSTAKGTPEQRARAISSAKAQAQASLRSRAASIK